jgi:hypothetical protein
MLVVFYDILAIKHLIIEFCTIGTKIKKPLEDSWPLKRGSIHIKFSMTGPGKGDLPMQVTT